MLPQVHLGGYHLAAEGRELNILLELPTGAMAMVVLPCRYEKLEESVLGCSYLIGAKIIQIADDDRTRLENFVELGLVKNSQTEVN